MTRLIARIENLAAADQQIFITTHSSYVLNRLGLDRLLLLHEGHPARLTELGDDTVAYFRKLPGYDTLRLVLAEKLALVEGPSDVLVLERAFIDETGSRPIDLGVDIVTMGGLTFKRALEVCACLDRSVVALQDNDGVPPEEVAAATDHLLKAGARHHIISEVSEGPTLEPQLAAVNDEALLRRVLGITDQATLATWMRNNKTEVGLRVLDAAEPIKFPAYILKAVAILR